MIKNKRQRIVLGIFLLFILNVGAYENEKEFEVPSWWIESNISCN